MRYFTNALSLVTLEVIIVDITMPKVVIASQNPTKILSVKNAFSKCFSDITYEFVCVSVPSGVADQPMGDEETFSGAENRVRAAQSEVPDADFFVGIEGGIVKASDGLEVFAWVIVSSTDRTGKSKTGTFYLPQGIADLVEQGKELGEADDIFFERKNSKQENGSVGILTKDLITRSDYYTEAVVLALIPHMNPDLY